MQPWDAEDTWDIRDSLTASGTNAYQPQSFGVTRISTKRQTQALTFINENQTEVITCRIFLVDVTEGGCQIEATKEQTDGNGFS